MTALADHRSAFAAAVGARAGAGRPPVDTWLQDATLRAHVAGAFARPVRGLPSRATVEAACASAAPVLKDASALAFELCLLAGLAPADAQTVHRPFEDAVAEAPLPAAARYAAMAVVAVHSGDLGLDVARELFAPWKELLGVWPPTWPAI